MNREVGEGRGGADTDPPCILDDEEGRGGEDGSRRQAVAGRGGGDNEKSVDYF